MSRYFFDTSAVVKRYQFEQGTDVIDRLFAEPGAHPLISRLGMVEIGSALAMRVRTGELSHTDYDVIRKRFLGDIAQRIINVVRLTVVHYETASRLIDRHATSRRLRTLDAVQLGSALTLFGNNQIDAFVCSDQVLCEIAVLEGLPIVNPIGAP